MITYGGCGLLNTLINKLPVEIHIPKYQYCGPGTKLSKRLARGDPGINPLDQACKEHDIAYSKNRESGEERSKADKILANRAWERVKATDSSTSEKAAAMLVTGAMKLKSKFGMGLRKKRKNHTHSKKKQKTGFGVKRKYKKREVKRKLKKNKRVLLSAIIKAARNSMEGGAKSSTVINSALRGAKSILKKYGGKRKVSFPRILRIPDKMGGALPFLIPLFAGLSATGALAGGAAGVAKAVNDARSAREQLKENKRHNTTMEAIALGKGRGLYLKPYKTGMGLYLKNYNGGGLKKKKTAT